MSCSFTAFVGEPVPGMRPCPCCGDAMAEALSQCAECDASEILEDQCPVCGTQFVYSDRQHWTLGELYYAGVHDTPGVRLCYECRNDTPPRYADRY